MHSLPEKGLYILSKIRQYMCGKVTQDPIWAKALTNVVSGHSCQTVTSDFNIGTSLSNQASVQGP